MQALESKRSLPSHPFERKLKVTISCLSKILANIDRVTKILQPSSSWLRRSSQRFIVGSDFLLQEKGKSYAWSFLFVYPFIM